MNQNAFVCKCIMDTVDGLSDGLSHYSEPSRVAVIYAISPEDSIQLYDPQGLLNGHEPILKELYLDNESWRHSKIPPADNNSFRNMQPAEKLALAGLISYGAHSGSVCYQMWFTEHHAEMSSIGPTERWLEHAAWRFSHDMANEPNLYTGISGAFLREYATHAVRDTLVDEMNIYLGWDTQLRIYPILDAVLGISRTVEEGAWARGKLRFVEPRSLATLSFLARFPTLERPFLAHHKHVRKLLTSVENSDRVLVSDGKTLVGIAQKDLPNFSITADFRGGHGFLNLNTNPICSFADGNFHSKTYQAKLVQVEEALLESDLDSTLGNSLFKILAAIVHNAENTKHGCTLVLDLNTERLHLSGQKLEAPIDLQNVGGLQLAQSLSKVDGALHIGKDLHLHGFACLLDGMAIAGEDRSRGARYNSALRFTAAHNNILVVVVSSDRPVSVIQEGVELNALCRWQPANNCALMPIPLKDAFHY
ncbi:MAG: DNA integrity scanning protein DisA nucleotide-binding domain protein [Desulfobacterales bacterium]|nr:DNA integrity scanning protein DisA nucleotide-binding domain protein [Desulfobacterales bacterium]